jgi:hypothetical protein
MIIKLKNRLSVKILLAGDENLFLPNGLFSLLLQFGDYGLILAFERLKAIASTSIKEPLLSRYVFILILFMISFRSVQVSSILIVWVAFLPLLFE